MQGNPDKRTLYSEELGDILTSDFADGPVYVRTPDGQTLRVVGWSETPRSRDPLLLTDTIDPEREAL